MMDDTRMDLNRELMLDGNAAGGILLDVFGSETTAAPAECAHCGNTAAVGALLAFTHAPGVVLRCPTCEQVVVRIVETPDWIYVDARGAAYFRLDRRQA